MSIRILALMGISLAASTLARSTPAHSEEILAVCPAPYRDALQVWIDHRQNEGLSVKVIDSSTSVQQTAKDIRESADETTRYVLLVGDAPTIGSQCDPTCEIPTTYWATTVTAQYGSTPTLSSDMPLGDFDSDGRPEAVVGRMPVRDSKTLEKLIARIVAYELDPDFGLWRGDVQLVGGIGGFGGFIDTAIESVTRTIVTSVLPAETRTNVAYASPQHLFYPKTLPFTDSVLKNYSRGARFWVYAGHGQVTHLDRVPATRQGRPVLDYESVAKMQCPTSRSPIALMLACYTGAIDAPEDCIAERMLLCDGGPIAVFAGSRVTMPYGNATAAIGLIDGVYHRKVARLGDAWLQTLVAMNEESSNDQSTSRIMVDSLAKLISPAGTNLVDERREHIRLYNLLGDPTLQLNPPREVAIRTEPGYDLQAPVTIDLTSPIDGELTLSIDRPLGASETPVDDPNNTHVASITESISANHAKSFQVSIPAEVQGPLTIRAFVRGRDGWATGAARTIVRSKFRTSEITPTASSNERSISIER